MLYSFRSEQIEKTVILGTVYKDQCLKNSQLEKFVLTRLSDKRYAFVQTHPPIKIQTIRTNNWTIPNGDIAGLLSFYYHVHTLNMPFWRCHRLRLMCLSCFSRKISFEQFFHITVAWSIHLRNYIRVFVAEQMRLYIWQHYDKDFSFGKTFHIFQLLFHLG